MSSRDSVTEQVKQLAEPIISRLGLMLWDVEFVKEGPDNFLRVYIDKEGGINIDDCEAFSREIDPLLDERDFIKTSYYLEVSSAGIERALKTPEHFKAFIGEDIRVKLYLPRQGRKELLGELSDFKNNEIFIKDGKEIIKIALSDCASVRLAPELF